MLGGRRFYFRPVLTIFTAASLAILMSLGFWQMHRLQWKLALIEKIEARIEAPPISFQEAYHRAEAGEDMEYTPVRLSGSFVGELNAKVFGSYEGVAGLYLFKPLRSDDGGSVYVNLGFVPQAVELTPSENKPAQTKIEGLFRYAENPSPPASWFLPHDKSSDGLWFIRDPALFAMAAKTEASPYYIDSFARAASDWPKGGTTRLHFSNNHFQYVLTWFGLAAALLGVWLIFSLQSPNKSNDFKK